jgi:biotin carboxylase
MRRFKMIEVILLFGNIHQIQGIMGNGVRIHNIHTTDKVPENLKRDEIVNYSAKDNKTVEEIVDEIVKNNTINAIVSFSDKGNGVEKANKFSRKYKLTSDNLDSLPYFSDKFMTRNLLKEIKLRSVECIKSKNAAEIWGFIEKYQKIVIKPLKGQGSAFVKVIEYGINSKKDVEDLLFESGYCTMIAEEFIKGNEYSVETISCDGEHKIIGITEKILIGKGRNPLVEKGHIFPAPLNANHVNKISQYVKSFLYASKLKSGITHTEVILNEGEPVMVESQLRAGGDLIPRLIERTKGIDIYKLGLEVSLDIREEFNNLPTYDYFTGHAGISYFIPAPGRIAKAPEVFEFKRLAIDRFVNKFKDDMEIKPITSTSNRTYGYIVATHDNPAQLKEGLNAITQEVVDKIKYVKDEK